MSSLAFSDGLEYSPRRDARRWLALVPVVPIAATRPQAVVAPCEEVNEQEPAAVPRHLLLALAVALVAHVGVVFWLQQPATELPIQPPQIPPMTVDLSPPPAQQLPPATAPKPLPQAVKPLPQPVAKPVVAPTPAPVQAAKPAPTQPVVEQPKPAPAPAPEHVTLPEGYVGYLRNPAPAYPAFAQDQGWEGHVLLKVHVLASGLPETVQVKQGSGRKVLDDAAVRTVQHWTFAPGKRGDTPVDGWVDVPIDFKLN